MKFVGVQMSLTMSHEPSGLNSKHKQLHVQ